VVVAGCPNTQSHRQPHARRLKFNPFKHALVQDVAHGTLLREPRRALHARIAEALESQWRSVLPSFPAGIRVVPFPGLWRP
jgi:predicted ATPase